MSAQVATAGRLTQPAELIRWAIPALIIASAVAGTLWIDRGTPLTIDETAAEASAAANP